MPFWSWMDIGYGCFAMLYKVKKTFPAILVLEEKDTGKEIEVQLLDGKSVYDASNDTLALIQGIVSNNYSIVCYDNVDYIMQDKTTNKQVSMSAVMQETVPIVEDGYVVLCDWVIKDNKI